MVFLRPVIILLPCLLASAALAETPQTAAHHVISAPITPVRVAPKHRPERHAGQKRPPAKPAAVLPAKAKEKEKPRQEAARPARPAPPPPNPHIGTVTGLPLPRFAALRADEVNFRAGPGDRYPVDWLYRRRGLPVEIEREFDNWRLVVAPDGTKGWVHEATLMGRRDFVVTGAEHRMRARPEETARTVAVLKPGVVGRIEDCPAKSMWCRVRVSNYHGWMRREDLWGVLPGETVASG